MHIFHYKGGDIMAHKKANSSGKHGHKKPAPEKQATTKVTTVTAVEPKLSVRSKNMGEKMAKFKINCAPIVAAAIAEFISTFIFAAVMVAGQGQPIIAMFALIGVVLAFGSISGGYLNPAIVIGAWITRHIKGSRALIYIVAQILGAMLALVVLNAFVSAAPEPSATSLYSTAAQLFSAAELPEGKEWFVFFSEIIGTVIFGFTVASAMKQKKQKAAASLTVGIGYYLGLLIAGSAASYIGATAILNPAVAISLKALSFTAWPIMIYLIAACIGSTIGFVLHNIIYTAEKEQ